jgi:hypothetical protein
VTVKIHQKMTVKIDQPSLPGKGSMRTKSRSAKSIEARPTGAAYRLGVQESTVSATQPVHRPITRGPRGCWTLGPEFTVNLQISLTVNVCRELNATLLPSDLPSD